MIVKTVSSCSLVSGSRAVKVLVMPLCLYTVVDGEYFLFCGALILLKF